MTWLAKILGHTGDALPFDIDVEYADGSHGSEHVFAKDMRDALDAAKYWTPLHVPAVKLTITLRMGVSSPVQEAR